MKKQVIKIFFLLALFFALPSFASASTWYVRTDGGSLTECTGQSDAAYPGSGTGQACAVSHIFWLLPPGGTPVISGGDTVFIASGSYKMGVGAPNTSMSACNAAWTYSCVASAIPSGPDALHPTKIIGQDWDNKSVAPPELWGSGRATQVFNLTGSNNVVLQYLNLTDHAQCGYNFTADNSLKCDRSTTPYGDQADYGIYAKDSTNVLLKDLKIHGFSMGALWAGRLTDWTFDGVEMHANAFNGWNGDIGHGAYGSGSDSSMQGTILFKNSKVNYSGCVEKYPLSGAYPDIVNGGCYGQGQGGYGDGLGLYYTEGNWIFQDTEFMYNTQDGLDMLYHTGINGSVVLQRVRAEGNVGQQIKTGSDVKIENSVIIGNCNYFYHNPIANQTGFPHCRATGTPLMFSNWRTGRNASILNSTITGPNKIFIEIGTSRTGSLAGTYSSLSKVASITSTNQYVIDQANDKLTVKLSSSIDPNTAQLLPRIGTTSYVLSGIWISNGDGSYYLTGIGAMTGGNYTFDNIYFTTVNGSAASITSDNQYALSRENDTIWARIPGSQDPNEYDMYAQYNNFVTKTKLSGTWISDGNGIYHMTGVGAQTGGIYALNYLTRAGVCDGSQKVYSRNNIFAGLEWWSGSETKIISGTYADTFYLDGWDGNGAGSCGASNPVSFDIKNSIVYNSKNDLSSVPNNVLKVDPKLTAIPPFVGYSDIYTYGERWNVVPGPTSPALDKSSSNASEIIATGVQIPTDDILKNPRPFGSGIDWGAYEVGSGADLNTPASPVGLMVE